MAQHYTTEAVKCLRCGKLHEVDSETYFTVHGNLTVGLSGGIIGNNFGEDGRLANVSIFCLDCLMIRLREEKDQILYSGNITYREG